MNRLLKKLVEILKQHATLIQTIGSCITILGVTNQVPKLWWQSSLLSWSISSQTTITIILISVALLYFSFRYSRKLEREIENLKAKLLIRNLTPEEQAEITKKQLSNLMRYLSKLFESQPNSSIKVINNGTNDPTP